MGVLNFVIFGLKRRVKEYGAAYPAYCPHCDNEVVYQLVKTRRWFHIYWIPLIPFTANRMLMCPICQVIVDLSISQFRTAKDLVGATEAYLDGRMSEAAYDRELTEFERQIHPDDTAEAGGYPEIEAAQEPGNEPPRGSS